MVARAMSAPGIKPGPKVTEQQLVRSICRDSFADFLREFWDVDPARGELEWNWHIELLCDEMQDIAERVFANEPREHDLLINISPGTTKSITCSIMFQPWTWTRMPTARHICGSHTQDLVYDLSSKARDIVGSKKYALCFPEIQVREDQNNKGHWKNTLGGDRFSCTVGGKTPTGIHAHFITIDDPIDPEKAMSDTALKKAASWMKSTLPTRKVSKKVSVTSLIMQRLHEADPAGEMLAKKRVRHVCLPAELTDYVTPRYLRFKYRDGLMDPSRLSREVLDEAAAEGDYYYASQFLQSPVPLGGGMFKVGRIHVDITAPKRFKRLVRYWDKAATQGGGAFSVGVLMGEDHDGRFWILDVIREQLSSDDREQLIKATARSDGRDIIVGIEQEGAGAGKESAEGTMRRLAGFRVRILTPSGSEQSKIIRADPFSVQVNAGNVYLAPDCPWHTKYLAELRHFPNSRYKDQVDASSGAFTVLTYGRTIAGRRIA